MEKFEFRLQSILNLKEQEEKKIQKELARLQKKRRLIEEKVDNYSLKKLGYQNKLLDQEAKEVDLDYAIKCRDYIDYLSDQIVDLRKKLNYWEEKIKECRADLLAKTKEKKMLTKLKDKQYETHWQEFLREEQKENDEIALNSYNHNNLLRIKDDLK